MYQTVLYSAESLSPAIYSPDGEATRRAMGYRNVMDVPREVLEGHPPTVIRSSGVYGARTLLRQQKLHCSVSAREARSADRKR